MDDDDSWILPALATNPALPDDLLLALAGMNDEPAHLAAVGHRRRDLPPHVAAILADSPFPRVRADLAIRADLPDDLIVKLARDPSHSVRVHVVVRPEEIWTRPWERDHFAPIEAYEILAQDGHPLILSELLASHDVPDSVKLMLAGHPRFGDLAVLRYGADAEAAAAYDRMIRDPDRRAAALAERRFRPPADLVDELLGDAALRPAAVRRVPLTAALAACLAADPDPVTRAAVTENPDLPDDLISALGHDAEPHVRHQLMLRPHLRMDLLDAIDVATDPDTRTRYIPWIVEVDDPAILATYARSRHVEYRRTIAGMSTITDDIVALLAADEDYAVRLILTERHTERVPETLLREILRTWDGYSTELILRSSRISAGLLDELIRCDNETVRWKAANRMTGEQLNRLADDPDPALAAYARIRLFVPDIDEYRRRLADPGGRRAAAAHPELPLVLIHELWERATAARHPSLPMDDLSRLDGSNTTET